MTGETEEGAEGLRARHTDFARAFMPGQTAHEDGGAALSVRVDVQGALALPSGRVVACDPFWLTEAPHPYAVVLPPGAYTVDVSVAVFAPDHHRVAAARLSVGRGVPVRWAMAVGPGQDPRTLAPGEIYCYGVDAGTGCFLDYTSLTALLAEPGVRDLDDWRGGPDAHRDAAGQVTPAWTRLVDAVYDWSDAFGDRLNEGSEGLDYFRAVVPGTEGGPATLIAFASGWGDGCYASYWGYDAADQPVCLVTDFDVLRTVTWT